MDRSCLSPPKTAMVVLRLPVDLAKGPDGTTQPGDDRVPVDADSISE
jgi:hypothetical protein